MPDNSDLSLSHDQDNRPSVYMENGLIIYRASSFGGCEKALALALAGEDAMAPPEQLQAVFDAGNRAEDEAIAYMENGGREVIARQEQYDLHLGHGALVRAHIDGQVTMSNAFTDQAVLLEVKSQNDEMWQKWTPKLWYTDPLWQKYAWQVSVPMIRTGLELCLARWNRDTKEIDYHFYERPFHELTEFVKRGEQIVELSSSNNLRNIGCEESYGCPMYRFHAQKAAPDVVEDKELTNLALFYLSHKQKQNSATRAVEEQKKLIVARLAVLGKSNIVLTNGTAISYTETDIPAATRSVKAYKQTRLTVTERKGGKGDE